MSKIIYHLLKNRKQIQLKSQGESMLPLLQPDDVLYFKKISFQRVRVNDLVMVKKKGKIFTHRVIYKATSKTSLSPPRRSPRSAGPPSEVSLRHSAKKSYIITKGDSNIVSDGKIYSQQIIGRVYKVKRSGQVFNPEDIYLLQSTQYFAEIIKIKKALEKEKIDFVFLKGLPLHLFYEKWHPRRIYADCDMLVSRKDWQKADKILKKHGFRKAETAYSKFHKLLKDKETEIVFYKGSGLKGFKGLTPIIFDIHFEVNFMMNQLGKLDALYPQSLIDQMTEQFLEEKRQVKIQSDYFPILSPINLIIYLSLHIFHHNFKGVFRLEFLDKVIRTVILSEVSPPRWPNGLLGRWDEAKNCIIFYRLQNFVYPVFLLLKKYFDTLLPDSFLNSIKLENKKMDYIRKNILNIDIFNEETRVKAGVTRFKNLFYLSPSSFLKKLLIVFNPQVIYSFFWVMIFLARRLLISSSKSR